MRSTAVLLVCVLLAVSCAATPAMQQVYTNDDASGWPCYRQPVITAFGSTVLAFVEGRNNTCCWGLADGYPKAILLRRSTDGGQTFGKAQQLWIGGPDYYISARDASSGKLFVFIQEGGSVLLTTSVDDGASWTTPEAVKLPSEFSTFKPSVGHGIQLNGSLCGPADPKPAWDGRIVLPFVCSGHRSAERSPSTVGDVKCPGCYSCLLLSDDGGSTWKSGAVSSQDGTREPSVVQVCASRANGTATTSGSPIVFMSERNMGTTQGHRAWAESIDGGMTIAAYGVDKQLVAPLTGNWTGIVGAVNRAGGVVAYSGPLEATARATMGVRASRTEAQSWADDAKVIWNGPAAYSDMVPLNSTHLGVIFEAGVDHFAEGIKLAAVAVSGLP